MTDYYWYYVIIHTSNLTTYVSLARFLYTCQSQQLFREWTFMNISLTYWQTSFCIMFVLKKSWNIWPAERQLSQYYTRLMTNVMASVRKLWCVLNFTFPEWIFSTLKFCEIVFLFVFHVLHREVSPEHRRGAASPYRPPSTGSTSSFFQWKPHGSVQPGIQTDKRLPAAVLLWTAFALRK